MLTPGGAGATAVLEVTDTTGQAEQLSGNLGIWPAGHVFLRSTGAGVGNPVQLTVLRKA